MGEQQREHEGDHARRRLQVEHDAQRHRQRADDGQRACKPVHGRQAARQTEEAAREAQAHEAEQHHQHQDRVALKFGLPRPQPDLPMTGIGEAEQHETAHVEHVVELAAITQAQEEHQVVGHEREQVAVQQAITVVVRAQHLLRLRRLQQAQRHEQRIGRFGAHQQLGQPRREIMLDDVPHAAGRHPEPALAVTGGNVLNHPALAQQIDVEPVGPGHADDQMTAQDVAARIVQRQMQPHRRRPDAELRHRRRAGREPPRPLRGKRLICRQRRILLDQQPGLAPQRRRGRGIDRQDAGLRNQTPAQAKQAKERSAQAGSRIHGPSVDHSLPLQN